MSLVEKELNKKNVELFSNSPEYQQRIEAEQKFIATNPNVYEHLRATATPIERQVYISHPDEEFSLRVRKWDKPEGTSYTATLKDRGGVKNGQYHRLEVETAISAEAYAFYAQRYPYLSKLRAEPSEGLTVDFIDSLATPIIEIETKDDTLREFHLAQLDSSVIEVTGDTRYHSESLAHSLHGNPEHRTPPETLEAFSERVIKDMIGTYVSGKHQVVVGLTGMSGSGKSTVTRAIQDTITEQFGEAYRPIVVSTDDYHRGRAWLEETYGAPWTEWDDPRVYNTEELARDLALLEEGYPLIHRHFDFETEETVFDAESAPSPFVIIEGLYAGSPDLNNVRPLHFSLPTDIATSIGRDVRRLTIEHRANRVFPTPESRLKYQLETALPTFLRQELPERNRFSASVRPIANRAFMLERLATRSS